MNCIVESWTSHEAELRAFLARKLNDARVAEDMLQDVFVKAIAEGSKFCQLENARAWLFRVARNQLVDYYRRKKQYVEIDDDIAQQDERIDAVATMSECLPQVLQKLSEQDRDIIKQCDLNGMNQARYAETKNIGLSAAKSRIQRARKNLKIQLHHECQVSFDDTGQVCCYQPCK